MTQEADHRPTVVHFGCRHTTPAEVCWDCSNEKAGQWVPVTQCPAAVAAIATGESDVIRLERGAECCS